MLIFILLWCFQYSLWRDVDNYQITNIEFIRCAYNGHSAFCKIPVLSLFLSLLKGQQRPGCHPTLPPCCDSRLLHLLAPTPIPPSGLPLPITYLSLGCLEVGTPIVNLNFNWVIPEKIHSPTTEGSVFWRPPPSHLDFQNCLSPPPLRISKFKEPPPIWISIKLLDTVILIYPQCRKILLST